MNNYLVRYILCDWPEEVRYAKLAENEHQIIKELIYELKYICKHERLEW